MTLESEKGEEERRKSKVLQETLKKTEECCSSPVKRIKMDTDVFRRFSPRRVTFIRRKRVRGKSVQSKLAEAPTLQVKQKRNMLQLLVKQSLCLSSRD